MALINCSECKKLISDKAEICLVCGAPVKASIVSSIVGTPIKIGNLEVAQHDFPNRMNWDDAKVACAKLGEGWKLPTKDELNLLYQNKDKIGDFADYDYWSSTESNNDSAWEQDFDTGIQYNYYEDYKCYVRAVRAF
jgi:hypothetical protein